MSDYNPLPSSKTLTTDELLEAETREIWGADAASKIWDGLRTPEESAEAYGRAMLEKGQAALCLSGGGIRSASFALGVLQALSRKGLLGRFHYLSTVSGGGYIGGFLGRWISSETDRLLQQVHGPFGPDGKLSVGQVEACEKLAVLNVQAALAEGGRLGALEPAPLRWLRGNSNFITPRVGLASADTWTAIATSVRNVLINWFVFAPALLLAVAVPFLATALLAASGGWFSDLSLATGAFLIALTSWKGARMLPSHLSSRERWHGDRVFWLITLPAAFGAAALAAGVAPQVPALRIWTGGPPPPGSLTGELFAWVTWEPRTQAFLLTLGVVLVPLLAGYVAAAVSAAFSRDAEIAANNRRLFIENAPVWLLGACAAACFYAWGGDLILDVNCEFKFETNPASPAPDMPCAWRRDVLATLAVVWGVLSQLLLTVFFVAFRRTRGSRLYPDLDREWLARVSAEKIRVALAWTLFCAGALLFRHVVVGLFSYVMAAENAENALKWLTWVGGLVSGSVAVFGGKARNTSHSPGQGQRGLSFSFDTVVAIATSAFILILLFVLGQAEFKLVDLLSVDELKGAGRWAPVFGQIGVVVVLAGLLAVTSGKINVNRFSLNGLYRNRLARAFLGAGRESRPDVDPFTGFAPSDNIRLHALRARGENGRVLLPVVNVALNLVGGKRLAWQERKAQAFVFTPIASGSAAFDEDESGAFRGAYVPSDLYAGNEPDLGLPGEGVSLATAIAISGAAASPSMGYHSSPATAFLMTLFNVRLGAWLPNPGADLPASALKSSGPRNALLPLASELLGLTNSRSAAVYLSDGGHFENLGLYEMVRRRCRYIVVSDAGCDPGATFEDLGNAIRKIRIDLSVEIRIQTIKFVPRTAAKQTAQFFVVGTISYPEGEGKLLYLKPTCMDALPVDVRAYSLASEAFPHESTVDQWFSESQFESYRMLGSSLVGQLGEHSPWGDLGGFFASVEIDRAPDLPPEPPEPFGQPTPEIREHVPDSGAQNRSGSSSEAEA